MLFETTRVRQCESAKEGALAKNTFRVENTTGGIAR